jgi:flavin-dependent dehydrogenase
MQAARRLITDVESIMASIPAHVDVVVIGAGPSGSIASALLHQKGYSVLVLEREYFPRFSIGESLLPQCMVYLEEAGMLEAVQKHGFQFKNGAAFGWEDRYAFYDFREKFSPGPGTTFQVDRASFDKLLADEASAQGVDIRYGHTITSLDVSRDPARVGFTDDQGNSGEVSCQFVLDASGFGRVASRLLDLEEPSDFPLRQAAFTHIDDHIDDSAFDREKILITVHPQERDIWYWLIPFSDGRCSLGVVASAEQLAKRAGAEPLNTLQTCVAEAPVLAKLLSKAEYRYPSRQITGYACNVKRLAGERFALLGNAGEFLDPVFSSGVTIAMRSASMAAVNLHRQLQGEAVDWYADYEQPLRAGVDTFRVFVESWYAGPFQDVIFFPDQAPNVRRMISSVLAGYAWDKENPIVAQPERRMQALADFCKPGVAE